MLLRVTVNTLIVFVMMIVAVVVDCKVIVNPNSSPMEMVPVADGNVAVAARQLPFLTGVGKETSTPDFIRLVVMRFIYGLASSMGVEERLEGLFNGAFVPPNADGDFFGFGGFGGDDGGDGADTVDFGALGDLGGIGALDGLFEGDGL